MNEIWSTEEEADRLRERFTGLNQAAFARQNKIPGGPSMLSQHLSGHRPIGLAAATAYAAGFGVPLREISPRLAREVAAAAITESANVVPGPKAHGPYPVISSVQAGEWTELCGNLASQDAEEWIISSKNLGLRGYILRVKGPSMENPGGKHSFIEGMLLHVNPDLEPVPGQFVAVLRENTNEAVFKRYVMIDGAPYLEAINPNWPQKYLPMQPGDMWRGVVVAASMDLL